MVLAEQETKEKFSVAKELERYNLPFGRMSMAWYKSLPQVTDDDEFAELMALAIFENLSTIYKLEAVHPGASRTLYDEFGIRAFGRYPLTALIQQYRQRDDAHKPYGVVVFPVDDWNGHFYSRRSVYEDMLDHLDGKVNTRFFEIGSKYGLLKVARVCHTRYGLDGNKAQFAVLAGHAGSTYINFGRDIDGRLTKGDLHIADISNNRDTCKEAVSYLCYGAEIVVDACSTGEGSDSLAENISKLGLRVSATTEEYSCVERFNPQFTPGGSIIFRPEYLNAPTVTYLHGYRMKN